MAVDFWAASGLSTGKGRVITCRGGPYLADRAEERAAYVKPDGTGMRDMEDTYAGSVPVPAMTAETGPPAPLLGDDSSEATEGAAPESETTTELLQVAVSTTMDGLEGSYSETVTEAVASAATPPG